jgi:hypothetical protein
MTIVMVTMGMNIMKSLGMMMVGQSASVGLQYAVGGTIHLMIGLFYGFLFAWLFGRVREWNRFIKGAVYGLAIAAIALVAMPLMSSMAGGGGVSNPCHMTQAGATNPCHGQSSKQPMASTSSGSYQPGAMNPCHGQKAMNPCHPKEGQGAMTPCHPKEGKKAMNSGPGTQGGAAMNPCHPQQAAANPCNPCGGGGGGGAMGSVLSLVNHLIYALTLAFVYKAR